jgi:hypothetical protein
VGGFLLVFVNFVLFNEDQLCCNGEDFFLPKDFQVLKVLISKPVCGCLNVKILNPEAITSVQSVLFNNTYPANWCEMSLKTRN